MALPRYHTCASLPTCRIYVHPFRNSFGLIELCRLSQDTRLTSDSCSSGWSFAIGFLHRSRCLSRLAELPVPPLFGRTADFHRIDTRALLGAHTKCPLSFRTAGILFSPMQNRTGALVPDDTNQSKSPPVRSVVILQRDDRVAGDESLRTRSGGSPWCGNIRWNPFQRSYRPDTVFCRHSTCCAFQAKSKSRSEFSSSVDA